jgi:Uncharacterised MFS-type transporter YbfB
VKGRNEGFQQNRLMTGSPESKSCLCIEYQTPVPCPSRKSAGICERKLVVDCLIRQRPEVGEHLRWFRRIHHALREENAVNSQTTGRDATPLISAMTTCFAIGQVVGPLLASRLPHLGDEFAGSLLLASVLLLLSTCTLIRGGPAPLAKSRKRMLSTRLRIRNREKGTEPREGDRSNSDFSSCWRA